MRLLMLGVKPLENPVTRKHLAILNIFVNNFEIRNLLELARFVF